MRSFQCSRVDVTQTTIQILQILPLTVTSTSSLNDAELALQMYVPESWKRACSANEVSTYKYGKKK